MLDKLKLLYANLDNKQKTKLAYLQVLVAVMSFTEILGVASIGPFMSLVGDMTLLEEPGLIGDIYRGSGINDQRLFLIWLGVFVIIMLTIAAMISMYTTWKLSLYGSKVGGELASRLYNHYIYQDWSFHAEGSSSSLINKISQECHRVTINIIIPLMLMNAKIFMAGMMLLALFIYNPLVATIGALIFIISYALLFRTVRYRLMLNGKNITKSQSLKFKLMNEGFSGIKDLILLDRQKIYVDRFDSESKKFSEAQGSTLALGQVPRYAMELIAFSSVIFLVIYLLASHDGNLSAILPIISIYALAGFKLLPAFQQIYSGLSQVKGNIAAFDAIREDLINSYNFKRLPANSQNYDSINLLKEINFTKVDFYYPGKKEAVLKDFNMTIPAYKTIGIVGASGSGKSTLTDIILGLITPDTGDLSIDGRKLTKQNIKTWQSKVGFVPQTIFLADCSIRENIAFGLPPNEIDEDSISEAIELANLKEFIAELPAGLNTRVGERGVQLSGGQRQRIGIARALYQNADLLIMDEATSALDGITERHVMDSIHKMSGSKTIIMIAHRLSTVNQCDCIFLISKGRLVAQGTFEELSRSNKEFQSMLNNGQQY